VTIFCLLFSKKSRGKRYGLLIKRSFFFFVDVTKKKKQTKKKKTQKAVAKKTCQVLYTFQLK